MEKPGPSDWQIAHNLALGELESAGILPDSPEGQEFLLRVSAFGIMGVQPPHSPTFVDCSCGRVHPVVKDLDGKPFVDTGWY